MGLSLRKIIKEELDDFQWIKDTYGGQEHFEVRLKEFMDKFKSHWNNFEVTYEPINEKYDNTFIEVGRLWLDGEHGNWYWDFVQNLGDGSFNVELFEKIGSGYELIDSSKFRSFEEGLDWVYDKGV
ncbi:MAG: hypothetical protein ACXADH_14140 [Candidatus Kariarchaeaceae archaeon]|jgi:hypothetical protein